MPRSPLRHPYRVLVLLLASSVGLTPTLAAPPSQRGADARRVFLNAERMILDGDVRDGIEEFEFLVQQFPASDWADDALLRIAVGWLQIGETDACRATATRLIESYGRTPSAAGGHALHAMLQTSEARTPDDLGRARDAFRRIPLAFTANEYPVLEWRTLAKAQAGEISLLLGEQEDAAATLVDAMENEPRTRWTPRAMFAFADLLQRQGRWQAAAQTLQTIVNDFDGSEDAIIADQVTAVRRRLSLIHRTIIRPLAQQPIWTRTGARPLSGISVRRPVGIASDSAGALLIVTENNDVAAMTDAAGLVLARRTIPDGRKPWWGFDGAPWVVTEKTVTRIDRQGGATFMVRRGSQPKPLEKMLAGQTGIFGDWYLIDDDDHRFMQFAPDGRHIRSIIENSRPRPVDVARDTSGRLYLLDRDNKVVIRYHADGALDRRMVSRDWRRPEAVAIDEIGNIYVLDRDRKTIEVFSEAGELRGQIGPGLPGGVELRSPRDIAVDGAGRLHIADRDKNAVLVME